MRREGLGARGCRDERFVGNDFGPCQTKIRSRVDLVSISFGALSSGFRVWGVGFRVSGFQGFRV